MGQLNRTGQAKNMPALGTLKVLWWYGYVIPLQQSGGVVRDAYVDPRHEGWV
jgi:hypothetical protein